MFEINFNTDLLNSIKEDQIRRKGDWVKRMKIRKYYEEKATAILSKSIKELSPYDIFVKDESDINKFGALNFLDIDAILEDGKIIKARFGRFIPSNTKYLFDKEQHEIRFNSVNFQKFKDNFDAIMQSNNSSEISKYYSDLLTIQGIKVFTPSLILYLKNEKEYNIMTEIFAKKILKNKSNYSENFDFYLKYNSFINHFKNSFDLFPQEIDLLLSIYNNSKRDEYVNQTNYIDVTFSNGIQESKSSIGISEETKIIESFPQFNKLIQEINILKLDRDHKERAHESLVETFFVELGYTKHTEIQYRKGRIDISIAKDNKLVLVVEVKRDWNLKTKNKIKEQQQAYNYASEAGVRHIILTNGDYYIFIDKLQGLSYSDNIIGEFELTNLNKEGFEIIKKIKKEKFFKSDF